MVIAFISAKTKKDISPFVVAIWQSNECGIDIAANQVIFGQLPYAKQVLVNAWIEIHREELLASWNAGRASGEFFKLDPLR